MADKHPYIPAIGGLAKTIVQFRKSFPTTVNADTLRKLGFAPKNESYVITTLRFLGLIDEEGKKTDIASTVFSNHGDSDFAEAFGQKVRESYSDLFELHGDGSWMLDKQSPISFFRGADQTSEITGTRQASMNRGRRRRSAVC